MTPLVPSHLPLRYPAAYVQPNMAYILTLNCGSSSIKASLFAMPREKCLARLHVADVGLTRGLWIWECEGKTTRGRNPFPTYDDGLRFTMQRFGAMAMPIAAVAHRVVHGGPRYVDSVRITAAVLRGIRKNTKLAPLHTSPNLKGIRSAQRAFPVVPHVAVFDTGFHKTMPAFAAAYPLPLRFFERHAIRRYGFHGISYRYVIGEAARMLRRPLRTLKLIACHLGSGCSVCAIDGGKSIDTSMGFTPVEGIMMRTRCGDVDPGVILHLQRALKFTPERVNTLLNHQSGLLGVSGGAATMPEVLRRRKTGDRAATLAFEMFCYRVEKYIGAYVATLGGLDGLIFTAGIGENQPEVRAQIVKWCRGFGLKIAPRANARAVGRALAIHHPRSRAAIFAIPTNEGLMMARDAWQIVKKM